MNISVTPHYANALRRVTSEHTERHISMGFIEDHEKELRSQRDAYVSDMIGKLKENKKQPKPTRLRKDKIIDG